MTLVSDADDPHLGPAWFFQVNYDKVVILPQEVITVPAATKRRRGEGDGADTTATASAPPTTNTDAATTTTPTATAPATNNNSGGSSGRWVSPPGTYPRHNVVLAGSTPWFCYWNGTLLEAFVYPNATSIASQKWASSYGGAASATTATGYGKRGATPTESSTAAGASVTSGTAGLLAPYPKVLKIEERRMPRGDYDQPYCVQMLISGDGGTAVPVRGGDGGAVVVVLDEKGGSAKRGLGGGMGWGRRETGTDCHCGWVAK